MFVSMLPNFIVVKTKAGKGVCAGRSFHVFEELLEFKGDIYSREDLPDPYVLDRYMQIDKDLYLGPTAEPDSLDDLVNHSCDPNCGLEYRMKQDGLFHLMLIAIRPIAAMEEITWDYSTWLDEDDWELKKCVCGARYCRHVIRDFKRLPEVVKARYLQLRVVMPRILVAYQKGTP